MRGDERGAKSVGGEEQEEKSDEQRTERAVIRSNRLKEVQR